MANNNANASVKRKEKLQSEIDKISARMQSDAEQRNKLYEELEKIKANDVYTVFRSSALTYDEYVKAVKMYSEIKKYDLEEEVKELISEAQREAKEKDSKPAVQSTLYPTGTKSEREEHENKNV